MTKEMHHIDLYREMLSLSLNTHDLADCALLKDTIGRFQQSIRQAVLDDKITESMAFAYMVESEQIYMNTYNSVRQSIWN